MTYVKTQLPTLKTHVVNLKRDAKDLSRDLQRLEVRGKLGSKTLYYPSWVKFSESLWEKRWLPCLRLCSRAIGADFNLSSLLHVSNGLATVRNKTYRWFSDGLLYFIQKFQLLFSIFNHSFQQLTFDDTWQRKQRKAYSYKNKWLSEFVKVKLP